MKTADIMSAFATSRRDEIADSLFNLEDVLEKAVQAAGQGFTSLRLEQVSPLNLSNTTAAKALITALEKAGYQTAWRNTIWPCEPTRPNTAVEYVELEISWRI